MEINDDAKEIVQELGSAINSAVERSGEVAAAIERLREAGYELELTVHGDLDFVAEDLDAADHLLERDDDGAPAGVVDRGAHGRRHVGA